MELLLYCVPRKHLNSRESCDASYKYLSHYSIVVKMKKCILVQRAIVHNNWSIPETSSMIYRVIFFNQSFVEMVNFKSVTRNHSKNEIFKNWISRLEYKLVFQNWRCNLNKRSPVVQVNSGWEVLVTVD